MFHRLLPALLVFTVGCWGSSDTPSDEAPAEAKAKGKGKNKAGEGKAGEGKAGEGKEGKGKKGKADGDHEGHGDGEAKAGGGDEAIGAFVGVDAEGARVFFVEPADGAEVSSPVHLVFGAEGVTIEAAGPLTPNSGHHHVIIDGPFVKAGEQVPKDESHIHYGKGQTEADLELPPGEHKLTMQLADGAHRSYGKKMSASITVTVK